MAPGPDGISQPCYLNFKWLVGDTTHYPSLQLDAPLPAPPRSCRSLHAALSLYHAPGLYGFLSQKGPQLLHFAFPPQGERALNALPVLLAAGTKSAALLKETSSSSPHPWGPRAQGEPSWAPTVASGVRGEEFSDTRHRSGPGSSLSHQPGVCEGKGWRANTRGRRKVPCQKGTIIWGGGKSKGSKGIPFSHFFRSPLNVSLPPSTFCEQTLKAISSKL